MEVFVDKKSQLSDQSLKGAVLGLLSYFAMKVDLDPALIAMCMPVVAGVLAYASTRVGDPGAASFLAKAANEAPEIMETVTKKAAAKKAAPAKKAAVAKKPAAKK
jgi:hypothetical protein